MKRTLLAFVAVLSLSVAVIPDTASAQPGVEATKKDKKKPAPPAKAQEEKAKPEVQDKHKLLTDQEVARHLQDISVTIVSKNRQGGGEGSGVVKTRKLANGDTVNFVWTAAHVVDNLRTTRTVIDAKSGSPKVVVEFDDATVVKALNEDGRMVGKTEFFAEVVRYSAEQDLALLRVRKRGLIDCTTTFYLDKDKGGKPVLPLVGTKLLHVGSLLGQLGSNSMTEGIMSQHGRLFNKMVFDQTTVTAFPGSSGGGVYLTDGRCVGLVLRGAGETFNLICPVRRLEKWAADAGVLWAVDDSVPVPSEDELRKLPVEDNGVNFSYSAKAAEAKDGSKAILKTILFGSGRPYLGDEETERNFPTYLRWTPAEK